MTRLISERKPAAEDVNRELGALCLLRSWTQSDSRSCENYAQDTRENEKVYLEKNGSKDGDWVGDSIIYSLRRKH
jgi:hypothetical protein